MTRKNPSPHMLQEKNCCCFKVEAIVKYENKTSTSTSNCFEVYAIVEYESKRITSIIFSLENGNKFWN